MTKWKSLVAAVALLIGITLIASPAAAADPAGPPCQLTQCNARNWYQDIRGIGMEGDTARLGQGIVAAFGPYLTTAQRSNLDQWIAYSGSSASFRLCARNATVVFASRVANANYYKSGFATLFKAVKVLPKVYSKPVSYVWNATKVTLNFSVDMALANHAAAAVGEIGGCS